MTRDTFLATMKAALQRYGIIPGTSKGRAFIVDYWQHFKGCDDEHFKRALENQIEKSPDYFPKSERVRQSLQYAKPVAVAPQPAEPEQSRAELIAELEAEKSRNAENGNKVMVEELQRMIEITAENERREVAGRPLLRYDMRRFVRAL